MRRFSKQRHGLLTLSEINVTPMLDLCLVLLVIFMITTPLLENTMELTVPTSSTADHPIDPDQVNVISVDKNGVLQLDSITVSAEELETRLKELKEQKAERLSIVIRAHHELPVQEFVSLMDVLQKLEIHKVGVVTQKEDVANAAVAMP